MTQYARWDNQDLVLACHIQPGAKKSELAGVHGERLKIRLQAPPVDGKANSELVRFLSKLFAVNKQAVSIESGDLSRQKRVRITNPVNYPAELDLGKL
ncbi:MAG: DUF167 family protein [Thiopseudomonas sp.]|nr:DUF167 family protein [Thiopseudomonas sp.]MCK9464333.1 DUF167 family protein [Thiopseudomonas sp.]